MNTFYKLRHKPTGAFYKPSTSGAPTNFSEAGKVYTKRPSKQVFGQRNCLHAKGGTGARNLRVQDISIKLEDWEVVSFTAVEDASEAL